MEPHATALLINDDPMTVDVIRSALAGEAVTFDVAYDFVTAMRCLDSGRYCGVVIDLTLPRSLDLLRRTSLPTVVIANGPVPASVREHVKLVLMKPVNTALLLNVIRGLYRLASPKEITHTRRDRGRAAPDELRDADFLWRRL